MDKIGRIIKLSQNENPFGPSPLALKAVADHCHSIHRYPDVAHVMLRNKLAEKYSISKNRIDVSAGSVEIVNLIIQSLVGDDENIVTPEITFVAYRLLAKMHGKKSKFARLINHTVSTQNLLSVSDEKTKVLFIANPNNPTGAMISHASLKELLEKVPSHTLVVIDEAYAEYVTDTTYPDSFALQEQFPNLIILRTFSKIYGLAGLRIGYAIAMPDIINVLRQHRTPFSINRLASQAALAAIDDDEYTHKCAAINADERGFLYKELKTIGLHTVESQANFIFMELQTVEQKLKTLTALQNHGIIARDLEPFGSKNGIRISVGRPEENRRLVESLKEIGF